MIQETPIVEELMESGGMSLNEARRFLLAENLAKKAQLTFGPYFVDETQPWNTIGMEDAWLTVFEYRVAGARTVVSCMPVKTAQYEDFKTNPRMLDFVVEVSRSTVANTLRHNRYIVGPQSKLP